MSIFISLISIVVFLIIMLNIIIHDFNYRHKTYGLSPTGINWLKYKVSLSMDKFVKSFNSSILEGLPQVYFYIPEKKIKELTNNVPMSTKRWKSAYKLKEDGSLQKVKVRHKGDNPFNYMFNAKSWRVKTKKSEIINGTRVFDYSIPQEMLAILSYFPLHMARNIGVLSPRVRLVEVFINDKSNGVYIETEKLDESFLRNNGVMPVNLYKGEKFNSDSFIGIGGDLFNNPGLWEKQAVFNQKDKNDYSDLKYFLSLMKDSETSNNALDKLLKRIDLDTWAKFSAYQVLAQSVHNDSIHNMRLVLDPWTGGVSPIPHDVDSWRGGTPDNIFFDEASNSLLKLLHGSSKFVDRKYYYLNKFINENILSLEAKHLHDISEQLNISFSRSSQLLQLPDYLFKNNSLSDSWSCCGGSDYDLYSRNSIREKEYVRFINSIKKLEKLLKLRLSSEPDIVWDYFENKIKLVMDGEVPASNIVIDFDEKVPNKISLDFNNNGVLDDNDIDIPFERYEDSIILNISIYANRIFKANKFSGFNPKKHWKAVIARTEFNFIMDCQCTPLDASVKNKFSKNNYNIKKLESSGVLPSINNSILFDSYSKQNRIESIVFSGENIITDDIEINDPATILKGTIFKLYPGVSMVFRRKVIANGTTTDPIRYERYERDSPWGTVAFHGKNASNSILNNIHMDGGSGTEIDGIRYTSMLSFHDVGGINVDGLVLSNNSIYDDMLHLIYTNNMFFKNIIINSSFSDSIDIDMSNNIRLVDIKITNSGNDGVDLMESSVIINNSSILKSNDKGVSTGERSNVLVCNSIISSNDIGIAVKDGSSAVLAYVDLKNNVTDISAFSKNWRYSDGGSIKILRSKNASPSINISNNSKLNIVDSLSPNWLNINNKIGEDIDSNIVFLPQPCIE